MTFWIPNPVPGTPDLYRLEITEKCCVGPDGSKYLMGGVAQAAIISALQDAIGKPLLWCTIQFLAPGASQETLEISLDIADRTRRTVQAGAATSVGDRRLHRALAAFGGRGSVPDRAFSDMPGQVPGPETGTAWHGGRPEDWPDLVGQFEVRSVWRDAEAGKDYTWTKAVAGGTYDAPQLALASDFILGAHPVTQAGISLDNTIRVLALPKTEWVLHVTEMAGFVNGAAQARQTLFDAEGRLLAISSQTGLVPRPA